ncbi:peptidylprolyl isomerase [Nannocystis sp. SCPEA4]|uniref:peptidylprolyl isomerase n=1 Tax=Nannocystis sp. SCPEA4 TaxID=2996787 RepID=UPI00226FDEE9|nr:peptidylprolyl isomerase [Nannocystis sp. SCPEA4]MCY1055342.1 peptidylprolyl isomerase [Nannocystis sp. SCPEA4]
MSTTPSPRPWSLLAALPAAFLAGCVFVPPPPLPEEIAAMEAAKAARKSARPAGPGEGGGGEAGAEAGTEIAFKKGDPAPEGLSPAQLKAYNIAQGDPESGEFTLEEALAGLPGNPADALWVLFKTPRGVMECELHVDRVPKTIANFVGLARGLRPWYDKASDAWVKRPYYDNTTFHRVIPGFMVQAGDPTGTGLGNPGYLIEDEIDPELIHDAPGVLSMANRGPNTGSAQFFITLNPTPHLDGKHTVFGHCNDAAMRLADDIALVPRDAQDKPRDPELLTAVEIVRRPHAR